MGFQKRMDLPPAKKTQKPCGLLGEGESMIAAALMIGGTRELLGNSCKMSRSGLSRRRETVAGMADKFGSKRSQPRTAETHSLPMMLGKGMR
ncbi:hypothetical protein QJS10_CPB21g00434 [Acorus calamus]|uniref:Uncharacterized protein n=1 Tax=Acorus calamus TaxID=4465 RepID=A0AAV9C4K8_ACOCL|nr:hypothetical protein QJS10_CPB21g00434 [Acorus calamus]